MRIFHLFLLFYCLPSLYAQDQHDYNWMLGYGPGNPGDFFGGNHLDFNNSPLGISFFDLPGNVNLESPCCMSDANGNLLFYTSGCTIRNYSHAVMENGDNINHGAYHNAYCGNTTGDGYPGHNGLISVPVPGKEGLFYLFHIRKREFASDANDFLYTLIDMNENNGAGKVLLKDQPLQWADTLALTVNAVRHGNGRDWWIITENYTRSEFYRYLVDTSGIHPAVAQLVPGGWIEGHPTVAQMEFSNNGTQMVQLSDGPPAAFMLYDFDRCTGELSNPLRIEVPEDPYMFPTWMCFSPNDRYLYVTNRSAKLYQFDLLAADITASKKLVGLYDGFLSIYNLPTGFFNMALGPDMKIYMTCTNGVNILHTIEAPDQADSLCDFRQHSIELPAHVSFYLPNLPNFRLYQQAGSPCDSLNIVPPLVAQWRTDQDSVPGQYTAAFTDYSYHAPVQWFWDFGDGSPVVTGQHPVHTFPDKGQYEVCLTACNAENICDTLCRVLDIKEKISAAWFTPAHTGEDYVRNVYPNPVSAQLWVRHGAGMAHFSLFDQTGRAILERTLAPVAQTEALDLSILLPGLYFWQVRTTNGQVATGKVMKN